jgi:ABC-type sugar transport system substrate-binding protein
MYRGILMTLKSFAGSSIVAVSRATPGLFSGEEAVTSLLRAEPSINILICGNAPITEGAAQVVVDQGLVGQVVVIGTDESPTINKLVDRGVIAASIVRDSRHLGDQAVKAFLRALRGGTSEPPVEVGFTVRERRETKP